jgi:alpha-N-arabinofuranosidase
MYGDWQLGHVPVERYALRHNAFVAAMRAKDPRLKVVAVGAPGRWNDAMLPLCAGSLDLLSGHHYTERKLRLPFSAGDAASYEKQFLGYSDSVAAGVRGIVADFRGRLGKGDAALDRLRLAIDEWGLVRDWNSTPDGPGVGAFEHYYCLGDAVMLGRGLHEILRAADVVAMANWAQTVNVIGTIKTSRNHAALDPAGHLLALYRAHLLGRLLPSKLSGDAPLDAVAAWDLKTRTLSLGLVNYSPECEIVLDIQATGFAKLQPSAAWRINGPTLGAINATAQSSRPEPAPHPPRPFDHCRPMAVSRFCAKCGCVPAEP